MNRPADAEIIFRLIPTLEGGKDRSIRSGWIPNFKIRDDYLTSAKIELLDTLELAPGEECRASVWFITPEIYPNTLWLQREIAVFEAFRLVGKAVVVTIFNPVLLRTNG